ncbi:putative importin-7 [Wickerhamomyces ciferrii]|uniref:Importin-7 n=1 Tax=Wickerhamomyces ciferrii (strain ATCC 14091 / BCRC 22168 / CBS 111 / JCM 3599 / NBRC 0793 / NRRL Y-1031 F-60-10) TaxID=1206466 RepID=K0KE03_WICCF|nr:putative importin-7 [Wickerhamomyces ciferrii]CCH40472.1 putative importin-7 [Wickerhamomyces ciferrii]
MDVQALYQTFWNSLSADQAVRQQAEKTLREAQRAIGFLGACLDILATKEVDLPVKKAAAVFFKNRIVRHWSSRNGDEKDEEQVDNDEKPIIRDRLLPTLVSVNNQLRNQLVPVLHTIIVADYPNQWSNLVDSASQLLYAQNLDSAYTGLLCFAEICRTYRWSTNEERAELDQLINSHFTVLLSVADTLLKEDSPDAGEMTKLLLKAYKFATYHDLPIPLQSNENITNWVNFHIAVINKPLPNYIDETLEDSEKNLDPWVKCKKWAYANLYRLFTRYGSHSLSKKYSYNEFNEIFNEVFIPQLLTIFLGQIDQWCNKKLWLGDDSLYYLLNFLENAVTQKRTWPFIKPHFELLVSHFVYPLLCPNDDTLDRFENDPQEYIHANLDIYDEYSSPDLAAIGLLITLTTKKKKTTLEPILKFAYNLLNELKLPAKNDLESAKKLEGALRLIGSISDNFVKTSSPYYSQMESFLADLVFPHFENNFGFIKARTCEVTSKFAEIEFQNQDNLGTLFRGILTSFENEHLPVQLEASLALQSFIRIPQFQEALSSVILPTMQKLLTLSNTLDGDAVSGVMQEIVEVFSEQLQPFAVELIGNLVEQFLRLAKELNDAANADVDTLDAGFDDLTDKQMAALGLLNTMITILLSFESSGDVIFKLEETFAPAVEFVLRNNIEDFFKEVSELIENSTFLVRTISPTCWKLFEILIPTIQNGIALLYLEDWIPTLNNFLVYGSEQIKSNPIYSKALFDLFKLIITSEDSSTEDYAFAGEIIQKLILVLENSSEIYLGEILPLITDNLINSEEMTNSYAINMIDTIVAALTYKPLETLKFLSSRNFTLAFFKLWFQYIPKFTRVYDLKLSTIGLLSIINLNSNEISILQLQEVLPEIGINFSILLEKLPMAIQDLEKRRKDYDAPADADDGYDFDNGEGDDDEWENEDADELADAAAQDDYLEFLNQEAAKLKNSGFYDDEDQDVIEDPLASTVLDNLNVFATFKESIINLQSNDSQKYQVLFQKLNAEQQSSIKDVLDL